MKAFIGRTIFYFAFSILPSMHTYIFMFFVCGRTGINLAQNKMGPADRGFVMI